MVQISENASKLILKMTEKNGIPGGGLRIGIKAGGCSGLSGPRGRPPPAGAAPPTPAAVGVVATGQADSAGLAAQLILVLIGQGGAEGRWLHGDPSVPSRVVRKVGVKALVALCRSGEDSYARMRPEWF